MVCQMKLLEQNNSQYNRQIVHLMFLFIKRNTKCHIQDVPLSEKKIHIMVFNF